MIPTLFQKDRKRKPSVKLTFTSSYEGPQIWPSYRVIVGKGPRDLMLTNITIN